MRFDFRNAKILSTDLASLSPPLTHSYSVDARNVACSNTYIDERRIVITYDRTEGITEAALSEIKALLAFRFEGGESAGMSDIQYILRPPLSLPI